MLITEDLLYYLWKFRLFNHENLKTISQETVKVVEPGFHNKDAGPDFEGAKILIGETLWAGNVEMHVKSSDWNLHGHYYDRAYDSVVLHVVFEHDKPIFRSDGSPIPTIELKDRIPREIVHNYLLIAKIGFHAKVVFPV